MAVLNYKSGPWFHDENRPFKSTRGNHRRRFRRSARRMAKRAETRLAQREMRAEVEETTA